MFAGALVAISLVVNVAVLPRSIDPEPQPLFSARLNDQQKEAVMRPLINSATDCVCRSVAADPRLGRTDFSELIVESFGSCIGPVRALIDTHDQMFGQGTGERFFMGPYLDGLPSTVSQYLGQRKTSGTGEP